MKLRDMMFLVIGGLLVISGMVLNSLLSGDAEAQEGEEIMRFGYVYCKGLYITDYITDNAYKARGAFGLTPSGNASLQIYGDDGITPVAYLGTNTKDPNKEMAFSLKSKSNTDKREVLLSIDRNGGRFDCLNSMGKNVATIGVGSDGGGLVDLRDKFGYTK